VGIDADFCRAVAAAVLGDPTSVEFRPVTAGERFVALNSGEVDEVWFVPSGDRPDKTYRTAVADRLALLTLLLGDGVPESEKRIRICTIEVEVPNLIGTVELFRALRARYPQHSFQAIIGSDLVKDLPQWRHPAALQREVSFLVVPRGLKSENEIIEVRPEFQIEYLPSPFSFTVSSTTLRALLADKKSIIGLMPRSLIEYVERNNLYDGVR
jgi:nicotinate (nicotinamide) nucleotide adenylyltransferase